MTTSAAEQSISSQDIEPFTPFQALLGVIARPRSTFARMRDAERGHWWVVFALGLIALVLSTVATVPIQVEMSQAAMAAQQEQMDLSPEQQAQFEQTQAIFSSTAVLAAIGTASGIIGLLIGYGVRAGLLYLFGLVLGGQVSFKQIWRMAVWTALPISLGTFVSAIAVVATRQMPTAGLTYILTSAEMANASPFLTAILGRIDVYTIWSLILIAVGMVATARLSRVKAGLIAGVYWLLGAGLALVSTALNTALSGTFGGG